MSVRADWFYRGKGQDKGQIYNENKQRHGLHVHKMVEVIHHFQQQFVSRLAHPLRQLMVAGADLLLKLCLFQQGA